MIMIIFMISSSVIMDAKKMNDLGWKHDRAARIFWTFLACSLSTANNNVK